MRYSFLFLSILCGSLCLNPNALADGQTLDGNSQAALEDTKDLLRNKDRRAEYFKENPQAKSAETKLQAISDNPEHMNEVYDISADVMDSIVKETGGDVGKMQEILMKAVQNPKAFHHRMTPAQKARIRALAGEIESQKVQSGTNK